MYVCTLYVSVSPVMVTASMGYTFARFMAPVYLRHELQWQIAFRTIGPVAVMVTYKRLHKDEQHGIT